MLIETAAIAQRSLVEDQGALVVSDASVSDDNRLLAGLLSLSVETARSSKLSETKLVCADAIAFEQPAITALVSGNDTFVTALNDTKDGNLTKNKRR